MNLTTTRKIGFYFSIFLLISSCSLFSEAPPQDAYLGGTIINPTAKDLIISLDSNPLDTIPLDANNKFHFYLPQVKPGLYSFTHGTESQIVYLEPGDSTIIYANTLDFDKSLNFSGRGAEKNNFLIDMYLLNEQNNNLILSNFKIEPEVFASKTDSIKNERQADLEHLRNKYNFSEDFMRLAETSIDYEYYDLRERYTYLINRYNSDFINDFPADFHVYRDNIDFNNRELENYYGYLRLIDNYLKNRAMENCSKVDEACKDPYSYDNIRRRLVLIDSLTTNPNLKKKYFGRLGAQGIMCTSNASQISSIFQILEEEKFDEEKVQSLKILAAIQKVYHPGNKLPPVKLVDNNNQEVLLSQLVKEKPTVFYNWSVYSPAHHKNSHLIIEELEARYPEVNFIGLNLDFGETFYWKNVISNNFYNKEKEYQLKQVSIDKKFLGYFLNKLLFVDNSGTVVMGNVQITSPEFEDKLIEFLGKDKKKEVKQIATKISKEDKPI